MENAMILGDAERRIREHRTADAQLHFVDHAGRPLPNLSAEVRLVRHEFKLGANAFRLFAIEDPALQEAYNDRYAALLNYATLPFYWGGYEPKPGETQERRLAQMADWCAQHGVATKGHPLVWHEVFPAWANSMEDAQVLARLEARVKEIVYRFQGRIDIWDVVNEATVSHQHNNTVGRWMKRDGAGRCVADSLRWAHSSNPHATLLYNDFNVSPDFEKLVAALLEAKAPVHTIGIQSHMHKGTWTLERLWQVCETYARFKLPLHFTEATVLSGEPKKDDDWHTRRTDWHSTPDGEARQTDYGEQFYTVLFSHPAVEAITWWDFSDNGSWQGAPAGLIRADMSPKPLYERLVAAFHTRWATRARVVADASANATARCFFGDHEVQATLPNGARLRGRFDLRRRGERRVTVTLTEPPATQERRPA